MILETLGLILAALAVGSFLGCVADRLPRALPIVGARSVCDHCAEVLSPASLIPVASWVIQGGRCRRCRGSVSVYYPAVELTAAAIVALACLSLSGPIMWISIGLGWALLTLGAMDVRHMLLSNVIMIGVCASGLAVALFFSQHDFWQHVAGGLIGAASLGLVNAAYRVVRGHDGLGAGDVWLLATAGAWLTWRGLPTVLLLATVSALLAIGFQKLQGTQIDRRTALPFGAFLCFGFWLTWVYGPLEIGNS